MKDARKHKLKRGSVMLGLGLTLTTLCHAQHKVIYWNGDTTAHLEGLLNSSYTDVIVNFVVPDGNCYLGNSAPSLPANTIQALHNAGKTVLISFGNGGIDSGNYASCAGNVGNQVSQLVNVVTSNGFDGVGIDFEDTGAFLNTSDPSYSGYSGVQFLISLTMGLYNQLPKGENHHPCPQTAYFILSVTLKPRGLIERSRPARTMLSGRVHTIQGRCMMGSSAGSTSNSMTTELMTRTT